MIQIYSPKNKNYEMNGNAVLHPQSCDHIAELGGSWTLEITHPIDQEGRWKYIEAEAVLSVPTFMGEKQLFRIDEITDKSDVEISAKAYPIFFDSSDDHFLMDVRLTGKTGQEALNIMTAGSIYSGESNITTVGTAYIVRRNLMNAIAGDSPSFVEIWGGEPIYDNFKAIINERAGGDYGAEIRYGKNMESVSASEDMSEVVTRIVPVSFNGHTYSKSYIDSPLINHYAKRYIREIKFEDVKMRTDIQEGEDTDGIIICENQEELDAALEIKCQEQFEAGIDLFKATIEVNVVELENTEEYKDVKDLVKIGLGDTVRCYNSRLDISTEARAIKIVWDCIENKVKEVILGDYKKNIFNDISDSIDKIENITNPDGSVNAEKVQGILNAMNTQLRYQKSVAQKQDVRAILFEDLDPNSELFGAMAIGTQGLQIANKRTTDGRDWDWTTAITAHGAYANAMITGLLSDKTGKNFWNLDTGEFAIEGTNFRIKSKNFNMDKDGNLSISGKYEVEYIHTIYANQYTQADLDRMQKIAIHEIEPTDADTEKYDFKGTGVDSQCRLLVSRMVNGYDEWVKFRRKITIDPSQRASFISTRLTFWNSSNPTERDMGSNEIGGAGIRSTEVFANVVEGKIYKTYNEENLDVYGTTGSFATADGKTVYVTNGLVTFV